jgi:hypothetical protein
MMIKKIALSILLAGSTGVAFAAPAPTNHEGFFSFLGFEHKPSGDQDGRGTPRAPTAAPEMDPASAISGLTLLVGGIAVMLAGRRRKLAAAV